MLIVVIGLLLLLMLIGFAFFTFASQEQSSAEYYADSAKSFIVTPNADTIFNFALEQLIIGPQNANNQSALWPGDKSLVPNMLGMFAGNPNDSYNSTGSIKNSYPTVPTDKHAFNGGFGLNIISGWNAANTAQTGQPVLDMNFNGIDDYKDFQNNLLATDNSYLKAFNHSGAAQFTAMGSANLGNGAGSATAARIKIFNSTPAIDVGYTYADINNAFLAYIGSEPSTGGQVVVPSFHRPSLLRLANGTPNTGWQTDNSQTATDTTVSVLRPHPAHLALLSNGTASTYSRFLSSPVAYTPTGGAAHTVLPFPFQVDLNGPNSNGVTTYGEQGLWTSAGSPLEYDVDNDGDGTREGIWLDLGASVTVLSDGRRMVPLYSFTVKDADGLLNLNTGSNTSWLSQSQGLNRPFYGSPPGYPVTSADPISHSNLGMSSPAEINLFWALVADPGQTSYLASPNNASNGPALALQQYRGFFGLSNTNANAYVLNNWVEMANMDTVRLLWGAPNYNVTLNNNGNEVFAINNVVAGRWGDVGSLLSALGTGAPGSSPPMAFNSTTGLSNFPLPGNPYFDDDGDLLAGLTDAGYVFNNSNLGYNQVAMGGDPSSFLLPVFGQGNQHLLQGITGPIANLTLMYPSLIGGNSNAPNNSQVYNSPVTVLPFGQPLDFTGAGTWTSAVNGGHGQFALTVQPNGTQNGMFLYYNGYSGSVFGAGVPASPVIPYQMALAANANYATALQLALTPGTAFPNNLLPYLYTGAMNAPYQGGLMANTNVNGLIDEPDETVSISAYAQLSDQTFPVDDTAAMQLSQNDYASAVGQSRARQLAAFNFELNLQAAAIRQRFTSVSFDRKTHGFASAVSGANNNLFSNNPNAERAWEYNNLPNLLSNNANAVYWDGTTVAQFPPMSLGYSMDQQVPAVSNNPNPNSSTTALQTAAEPFRMELAALIGAKLNNNSINGMQSGNANTPVSQNSTLSLANFSWFGSSAYEFRTSGVSVSPWQQQERLNINRLLTVADPNYAFGHSLQQTQQNPLRYRQLTPHPTMAEWNAGSASIGTTLGATGAPATSGANAALQFPSASNNLTPSFNNNPALQEYWARRDRQQMARDIYVMLYMFGGGQDTANSAVNYATQSNQLPTPGNAPSATNYRPVYQDWQLAEMAQFAVNVVDSLDRDDTITMFEYDKDLSNGWNLDDDPMTMEVASNLGDRGVVFGVEAQQLAFNEALVIVSRVVKNATGTPVDHGATAFDDRVSDHTFTALELYNTSAFPVNVKNGNWQIVTLDPTNSYPNLPLNPQQIPQAAFTATVPTTQTSVALTALTLFDSNAYGNGAIPAASPYTIGSRTDIGSDNANGQLASTFVVDPNWTSASGTPDPNFTNPSLTQMVPQYVAGNTETQGFNLDLLKAPGNTFTLTDYQYNALGASSSPSYPTPATNAGGGFFDMTTGTGSVTTGKFNAAVPQYVSTFVLRRRLNLNRPAPTITPGNVDEIDNPFIEVDRITYVNYDASANDGSAQAVAPFPSGTTDSNGGPVAGAFFNLRDPATDVTLGGSANAGPYDIQPKLTRLVSKQRRQPLDGYEAGGNTASPLYPTVLPNWPASGSYPAAPATPAVVVPSFISLFTKARIGFFQNQTVLTNAGITPTSPTPFPQPQSNLQVFQPNTFGQTSQYMPANTAGNNGSNTGGMATATPFTLWQPHFDRDFASIGELLSVPLYGPSTLTQSLAPKDTSATSTNGVNLLASEAPLPPTLGGSYQPLVAQAKFFRPQHPLNIGQPSANQFAQFDNRWHRVLELLEVPSRANMQIENNLLSQYPWLFPQALQRVPGKINLNTVRHGEVFYGLLDDPAQFSVLGYNGAVANGSQNGAYIDNFEAARNWWLQTMNARDGYDWGTNCYMPGSPSSRPFRPLSYFDNSQGNNQLNSTDDTLLRTLPYDVANLGAAADKRGLFEARSQADLSSQNGAGGNIIDYYTRQRLLSKIAGNTTQRSNVFVVWITVGFFDVYQPSADPVNVNSNIDPAILQIGAEMTDQTRRRGFFVIDRSMLEDAWVPDYNNPQNGYYDYSKFILYRKTIQ